MTQMEELRQNIFRHATSGSTDVAIQGLTPIRADASRPVSGKVIYKPMVCVVAQNSSNVVASSPFWGLIEGRTSH
jgi:hypothetical protein